MAQKCTISSYTPPSWWEPMFPYCYYTSSNMSSCDDHQGDHFFNVSTNCFTDSSDHSELTGEDSSRETFSVHDHPRRQSGVNELTDEHVSGSQLWTHSLLGGQSNIGEFGNNQEAEINLVDANLSNKSNNTAPISPEVIFEPVYDYLTKVDNDWEFSTSSSSSDKKSTPSRDVDGVLLSQKCIISSYTPPSWWEPKFPYFCYPSSNMSSCDDHQGDHFFNVSTNCFTDSSDHSRLTEEDSSRETFDVHDHHRHQSGVNELMDEHVSGSQLWTHILLGGRSNIGEFGNNQEAEINLLDANLSHNNNNTAPISPEVIFDPVYDYLTKMDSDWEFSTSSSSSDKNNTLRKQVNGLTKQFSNWSMSPPPPHDPEVNARLDQILPCNDLNQFDPYSSHGQLLGDHVKMESKIEDSGSMFKSSFGFSEIRYDIGLNISNPVAGDYCSKYYCGTRTCYEARNLGHSVNGRPCKAQADNIKTGARSSDSLDRGKQVLQSPRQVGKRYGAQNNEGKKKRISEEASPTSLKKPKQKSSIAAKAPKQKWAEKVNALQQIVSPYGKTDAASVLLEAIQDIKCLQEQVQILSNPYMKNLHKDQWLGSLKVIETRDHAKVDLRSKGLGLVPISCIPQVFQESNGSDYWTPYRSCLYR